MTAISLEIDSALVKEYIETGSHRAANEIIRTYRKFVFATALRYVEDYDDADDVAQDVFIRVFDGLSKFEGKSSMKTWLYKITVNISLNYIRKRKILRLFSFGSTESESSYASDDILPDKSLENSEFERDFLKILSELPVKQRETFALRYFDELTYEEMSKILGTSVGGLKANYHQAVKKITNRINDIGLGD